MTMSILGETRIRLVDGPARDRGYTVPMSPDGLPPQMWQVLPPQRPATFGPDFTAVDPWADTPRVVTYECGPLPGEDGVWPYRRIR